MLRLIFIACRGSVQRDKLISSPDRLCLLWLNEFVTTMMMMMMKHLAVHWEGSLKEVNRSLALLESVGTELFLRDTHSAIEVPDTRIYSVCAAVD
jgi:hypothetical protein